jgi:hypothetical protein
MPAGLHRRTRRAAKAAFRRPRMRRSVSSGDRSRRTARFPRVHGDPVRGPRTVTHFRCAPAVARKVDHHCYLPPDPAPGGPCRHANHCKVRQRPWSTNPSRQFCWQLTLQSSYRWHVCYPMQASTAPVRPAGARCTTSAHHHAPRLARSPDMVQVAGLVQQPADDLADLRRRRGSPRYTGGSGASGSGPGARVGTRSWPPCRWT